MLHTLLSRRALLIATCCLAACGGDPSDDWLEPGTSSGSPSPPLRLAHHAANHAQAQSDQVLTLAVQAVLWASSATGTRTLTGVLRQPSADDPTIYYEPSTDGALTLHLFDDDATAFEVVLMYENLLGEGDTPSAMLGADHRLEFTIAIDDHTQLAVHSQKLGIDSVVKLAGRLVQDEVPLDVDLTTTTESYGDVDSTGSEFNTTQQVRGSVEGPDFSLAVDQGFDATTITVTSTRRSASASTSVFAHTLDHRGHRYTFEDVTIRRNFLNGKPNDPDFWLAEGSIERDGSRYASYALEAQLIDRDDQQGFVVVWLTTPGERFEIERWLKDGPP